MNIYSLRKHHAAHYAIGIAALAIASWALLSRPKAVTVIAPGANLTQRQVEKLGRLVWAELEQTQVDALQAVLHQLDKRPAVIFCADTSYCGDLALDFENAFESDGWKVDRDRLIYDGGLVGIAASTPELAAAIAAATGLSVQVLAIQDPRLAVMIGRKPR